MDEKDNLITIEAKDVVVGDVFRIGGWRAVITDVLYMPYSCDEHCCFSFSVGESEYQVGQFYTPQNGPFTILKREPR